MRVLHVHNGHVAQGAHAGYGGEEIAVERERELLRRTGHFVEPVDASNEDLRLGSATDAVAATMRAAWSRASYQVIAKAIRSTKPDVLHVHNTFFRLSPSVFWAGHLAGVTVVATLHTYRLLCVNALLLRDGLPCEACIGHIPWRGARHRCYRGSRGASLAIGSVLAGHRLIGTYQRCVDGFIVLSEFARRVFERGGLPARRLHVKPNFGWNWGAQREVVGERGSRVAYVGRLSFEKGVDQLLEAWRDVAPANAELVIVGDGPDRDGLVQAAGGSTRVTWRGWVTPDEVREVMASSRFVVVPSRCYEGFPLVAAEAFSVGTPLIAPSHGPFPEITGAGVRGLLFEAGRPGALAEVLRTALAFPDDEWRAASKAARTAYERDYSPDASATRLLEIYERARKARSEARR